MSGLDRRFSREFKLAAVERMSAGENVSALARELGVLRKCLYQWRDRLRVSGPLGLRERGRPTVAEAQLIRVHERGPEATGSLPGGATKPTTHSAGETSDAALVRARRRIVELERTIGRQQMDLDFFQQALRQVGQDQRQTDGSGATRSTRSSKR